MRRLLVLSLMALPVLLACSEEDPAPQFIEVGYQIRCLDCQPASTDDTPHKVSAVAGDSDILVACHVDGSKPRVTFSVMGESGGDAFAFRVKDVSLTGKEPGDACVVTVKEGSNTYEGNCTAGAPSDDVPCQVKLEQDDDVIHGSVLCRNIPNALTPTVRRNVVAPSTSKAAQFEIHGCTED
jgi:hypothetical protein